MRTPVICFVMIFIALSAVGQQLAMGPNGVVRQDNVQVLETRIGPRTYGTGSSTAYTVSAFGFGGFDSSTTFNWSNGRYLTGGPEFVAPVILPEGALVNEIEVDACDSSATGNVSAFLTRCPSPENGACFNIAFANTGFSATPGCNVFSTVFTPITIDNIHNSYIFEVLDTIDGTATTVAAARLYYKLQISPDPATATFADVPVGHPFHRFVEALVAAGITGGCGNGNYCPDAPITRGQMAVFLSAALGLHWAP